MLKASNSIVRHRMNKEVVCKLVINKIEEYEVTFSPDLEYEKNKIEYENFDLQILAEVFKDYLERAIHSPLPETLEKFGAQFPPRLRDTITRIREKKPWFAEEDKKEFLQVNTVKDFLVFWGLKDFQIELREVS